MDISHWKCRALQFLTLRNREGIFHAKEKVLPQAGCFCLDCWQFGRIWSLQDHWRNLLMLEAFKRLFGEN
jgi:hypothetical protein